MKCIVTVSPWHQRVSNPSYCSEWEGEDEKITRHSTPDLSSAKRIPMKCHSLSVIGFGCCSLAINSKNKICICLFGIFRSHSLNKTTSNVRKYLYINSSTSLALSLNVWRWRRWHTACRMTMTTSSSFDRSYSRIECWFSFYAKCAPRTKRKRERWAWAQEWNELNVFWETRARNVAFDGTAVSNWIEL